MTHAFEVFDREEKGFFKLYELEQALKSMHGAQDLGESELADILALADPNGDGHVNLEGLCSKSFFSLNPLQQLV